MSSGLGSRFASARGGFDKELWLWWGMAGWMSIHVLQSVWTSDFFASHDLGCRYGNSCIDWTYLRCRMVVLEVIMMSRKEAILAPGNIHITVDCVIS
jgi:hypothetical protein